MEELARLKYEVQHDRVITYAFPAVLRLHDITSSKIIIDNN